MASPIINSLGDFQLAFEDIGTNAPFLVITLRDEESTTEMTSSTVTLAAKELQLLVSLVW